MNTRIIATLAAMSLVATASASFFNDANTSTPLIPRSVLFGNPDRAQVRINPTGTTLSWLASVNKVLNLHIAPVDNMSSSTVLTHETGHGITSYLWAWTGKHILYPKDTDGDENDHIYCSNIITGETKDLTPFKDTKAEIVATSHRHPEEIIVALNNRNPKYHDLWRLNISTGETTMILQNDEYAGFELDEDFNVRLVSRYLENGSFAYWKLNKNDTRTTYCVIDSDDVLNFHFVGFDATGEKIRVLDARGRDTAALFEWDFDTKESLLIADDPRADVSKLLINPITQDIEAVGIEYDRSKWILVTDPVERDLRHINVLNDGEFIVTSRTANNNQWTVSCYRDNGPVEFYLYDRKKGKAKLLCVSQEDLLDKPLAKMRPITIKSRDGLEMVSYLTLPINAPVSTKTTSDSLNTYPMVLLVHGGPVARDSWGYNPEVQLLANRGYAVLQVNFRGSTGFGKNYINAGVKQWGAKMQDDLVDAVKWAVDNKIADKKRIAIMGGSYGGYATLMGLARDPELFAAGVDIVGPSNLETLLATIPPYWEPAVKYFHRFVGNPNTSEGLSLLKERSPLTIADQIRKPLLIGQGANDPRVKKNESDQIVASMKKHHLPVIYLLYPDEGHGFSRPENNMSFMAITEQFLKQHLGGEAEPVENAIKDSSVVVLEDSDRLTSELSTQVKQKKAN